MASIVSSLSAKYSTSSQRPRSEPRTLPVAGFDAIAQDQLVEEETVPEYSPEHFYPVRLGEVLQRPVPNRGETRLRLVLHHLACARPAANATDTWRSRSTFATRPNTPGAAGFTSTWTSFSRAGTPAEENVRKLLSSFEVIGPRGKHVALALQVSQMSIRDMDAVFMGGRGFCEGFVKGAIKELPGALDFLHTEVQCPRRHQIFILVICYSVQMTTTLSSKVWKKTNSRAPFLASNSSAGPSTFPA
ncbi:hypothetical protein LX36DRAFT_710367 [Colletotrichum falcatum]|nr:hypothetical protein LX36DRAFT_710367 [Colletotrichum falcatum]